MWVGHAPPPSKTPRWSTELPTFGRSAARMFRIATVEGVSRRLKGQRALDAIEAGRFFSRHPFAPVVQPLMCSFRASSDLATLPASNAAPNTSEAEFEHVSNVKRGGILRFQNFMLTR